MTAPAIAPPLEWEVNAWRTDSRGALLSLAATLLIWLLLIALRIGLLPALLLGALATSQLVPGFSLVRCRVDERGVARKRLFFWERREWERIRRARVGPRGLFVSPYSAPRRLDAFHGLFLPVPREARQHERLRAEIATRLAEHGI